MRTVNRYDVETQDGALVTAVAPPPPRAYEPVTAQSLNMVGRRVVLAQPLTWWVDMRAVSEPHWREDEWYIEIADEAEWYAAGQDADAVPDSARLVVKVREVFAE